MYADLQVELVAAKLRVTSPWMIMTLHVIEGQLDASGGGETQDSLDLQSSIPLRSDGKPSSQKSLDTHALGRGRIDATRLCHWSCPGYVMPFSRFRFAASHTAHFIHYRAAARQ